MKKKIKKSRFWGFKKARDFVRKLGLKSQTEWKKFCNKGKRPLTIPWNPNTIYKDKWNKWGDWLGNKNVATKDMHFMPFERARKIVQNCKFKNQKEYYQYRKSHLSLAFPHDPHVTYKNKGWINWYNFLGKLKENDFRVRNRQYVINHDYFKKWSHNMAYILGLWFADGCVYRGTIFSITLHKKDKYMLELIFQEMKSNYPIYKCTNSNCYHIQITSESICNDIVRLGGKERKSLDVKFPKVPKKYLSDFIRGVFDGDGWISKASRYNQYKCGIVSGSKNFMESLCFVLRKNIKNFGCKVRFLKPGNKIINGILWKSSGIYRLDIGINDTRRFRSFIYSRNTKFKLTRKYKIFKKIGVIKNRYLTQKFITFKDIKNRIKNFKFKNQQEWRKYAQKYNDVPNNPQKVYKKSGWCGWRDFLNH